MRFVARVVSVRAGPSVLSVRCWLSEAALPTLTRPGLEREALTPRVAVFRRQQAMDVREELWCNWRVFVRGALAR